MARSIVDRPIPMIYYSSIIDHWLYIYRESYYRSTIIDLSTRYIYRAIIDLAITTYHRSLLTYLFFIEQDIAIIGIDDKI